MGDGGRDRGSEDETGRRRDEKEEIGTERWREGQREGHVEGWMGGGRDRGAIHPSCLSHFQFWRVNATAQLGQDAREYVMATRGHHLIVPFPPSPPARPSLPLASPLVPTFPISPFPVLSCSLPILVASLSLFSSSLRCFPILLSRFLNFFPLPPTYPISFLFHSLFFSIPSRQAFS